MSLYFLQNTKSSVYISQLRMQSHQDRISHIGDRYFVFIVHILEYL